MTARPIIFNGDMVRAILDGRKTQTRRVVPERLIEKWCDYDDYVSAVAPRDIPCSRPTEKRFYMDRCQYGQPGDLLYVREGFCIGENLGAGWEPWMEQGDRFVIYEDVPDVRYIVPDDYVIPRNAREIHNQEGTDEHWRRFGPMPSIHMPRWASRIALEITDVRVERLQDISEEDAMAEGCDNSQSQAAQNIGWYEKPRRAFQRLWDSIYGTWDANPWVWVVEFKPILKNVDEVIRDRA